MKRLAVFASGSGTNAENIIRYFKQSLKAEIILILSNKPDAFVLKRANKHKVPVLVFNREEFYNSSAILEHLHEKKVDLIILAGFLWLVPQNLLDAYPDRIVNIHPALLPAYGGKGMYGRRVHEAVIENQDEKSGITIHIIDREYDKGSILFQANCPVLPDDTPTDLATRIHKLEYQHFPPTIEKYLDQI